MVSVKSGPPLTWKVSTTFRAGFQDPSLLYSRLELSLNSILYQSTTSRWALVIPQAIESLKPLTTVGAPASDAPIACTPGALSRVKYQIEGRLNVRCGSLQSIGEPVDVLVPLTAQLLLPTSAETVSVRLRLISCAGRAGGILSSWMGLNVHAP